VRTTSELAPMLALPWLIRLRYILLGSEAAIVLVAVFIARIELPLLGLSALLILALVRQRPPGVAPAHYIERNTARGYFLVQQQQRDCQVLPAQWLDSMGIFR